MDKKMSALKPITIRIANPADAAALRKAAAQLEQDLRENFALLQPVLAASQKSSGVTVTQDSSNVVHIS